MKRGTVVRRRRQAVGAVTLGLLVALTACGKSSGSGTSSTGSTGDAGGDTITLGVITSVGSPLTNYPDIQVGAQAAVDAINKAGGVNGKKLAMWFCNTKGDANQSVACAREAPSHDVVAVVGQVDVFSAQSQPVLDSEGIPNVGAVSTGAQADFTSADSFPLTSGNFGAYATLPHAFKAAGMTKMVVATIDTPGGVLQTGDAAKVGASIGLEVAPMIKIPSTGVTDYSPYAQQVKDSGAQGVIVALGPAGFQAYVKAADAIGSTAVIGGTAFTFGQSEAAGVGALADKMLVTAPYPSTDDNSVAGVKQYNAELDADKVEQSTSLRRLAGLNAWLSVYAASKVAATITGTVDKTSMTAALQKAKGIDLFGLATYSPADLTTDAAKDAFPRFPKVPYHVLTFKDGKMVDAGQPTVDDPLAPLRSGA